MVGEILACKLLYDPYPGCMIPTLAGVILLSNLWLKIHKGISIGIYYSSNDTPMMIN